MQDSEQLPEFKCSPIRAMQAAISSDNWVGNLLWLSLGALTSSLFIGQIGIFGYGAELLHARAGRPENPNQDIDSNRLGDYIAKGIWPFVVSLVVQIALSILFLIPVGLFTVVMIVAAEGGGDAAAAFMMILGMPFLFAGAILLNVATVPFMIRAMITQDFQAAFDFDWAKHFVRVMFWDIAINSLLFGLLSMATVLVGFLFLCVGYIPAVGMVLGGMMNLYAQWYEIYLSRGGMPVESAEEEIIDASLA